MIRTLQKVSRELQRNALSKCLKVLCLYLNIMAAENLIYFLILVQRLSFFYDCAILYFNLHPDVQ